MIEEYNAALVNIENLLPIANNIFCTDPFSSKDKAQQLIERLNLYYWGKLFQGTISNPGEITDFFSRTLGELSTVDFNLQNIFDALSKFKSGLETAFNADITGDIFENRMLNDKKSWRKNKMQPVTVDKKIIVGGGYCSTGFSDARKIEIVIGMFNNPADIDKFNIMTTVHDAKRDNIFKKIDTKYFTVDIFKGDRLHLTFKDLSLLKKFNLYVNKTAGRLPANYGVKLYNKLNATERRLVDEYEGQQSYNELHANYNAYCVKPFETLWQGYINSNVYLAELANAK